MPLNGVRIGLSENEGRAENGQYHVALYGRLLELLNGFHICIKIHPEDSIVNKAQGVIYALDKHRTPVRLIDEYHRKFLMVFPIAR